MVVTYEPSKHITEFVTDFRKCWTLFGIVVLLESGFRKQIIVAIDLVMFDA
jgi:hypothetical protein